MGITLYSPGDRHTLDLACSGFYRFRLAVARAADPELGTHYSSIIIHRTKEEWQRFDNYTKKLECRYEKQHGKRACKVFDFLFMSDCEGHLTPGTVKQVAMVMRRFSCDQLRQRFGYAGRNNPVTGKELLDFFEACSEQGRSICWN